MQKELHKPAKHGFLFLKRNSPPYLQRIPKAWKHDATAEIIIEKKEETKYTIMLVWYH